MSDTTTRGGFAADPTTALSVSGSTGCCGNPASATTIALPDPTEATGSCCGTAPAAKPGDDATAKTDADAAGTGCCG